jgi:hypothetical protein
MARSCHTKGTPEKEIVSVVQLVPSARTQLEQQVKQIQRTVSQALPIADQVITKTIQVKVFVKTVKPDSTALLIKLSINSKSQLVITVMRVRA